MKATALLKKQHRKVEETFDKLEDGDANAAFLLTSLANDLAAHMLVEQTVFYPAVRSIDPELVEESYEEHANAELAMKRLLAAGVDDPTFDAKVAALRNLIQHHIEEEEEDLFPEVEDRFDDVDLEQLGTQMLAVFERAREQGYERLLPDGLAASADDALSGAAGEFDWSPEGTLGRPPARATE